MPRAWPQSINRFDAICGDKPSSGCRLVGMAMARFFYIDYAITDFIAPAASDWSQTGSFFRFAAKIMEWSMHGIPWLAGIAMSVYITDSRVAAHLLINLLFALVLDLLVVCTLKLMFRRRRPRGNRGNMIAEAPYVDQFSFPSGHSSRAAMLTKLLVTLIAMDMRTKLMVWCFPICLGLSRIMLGRHYFSDVVAGLLIGLVECDLAIHFWLPPETCLKIWRFARREPYE